VDGEARLPVGHGHAVAAQQFLPLMLMYVHSLSSVPPGGPSAARSLRSLRCSDAPGPRRRTLARAPPMSLLARLGALGACRARQSRARQTLVRRSSSEYVLYPFDGGVWAELAAGAGEG